MAKVDLPEGFGVAPADLEAPTGPVGAPWLDGAGQGLKAAGSEIANAGSKFQDAYKHFQEREGTAQGANLLTTYQHELNTSLSPEGGLMSQRGDQALAASQGLYEKWQTRRDEIAKGATNEYARRMFLQHSATALEEASKQADSWVGHQRYDAQESAVNGAQAIALQTIRQSLEHPGIDTGAAVAKAIAQPEEATAALQLSPEARQAAVAKWRQQGHSTVLEHFIDDASNPDSQTASASVQSAKNYFTEHKEELGSATDHYQKVINGLGVKDDGDQFALGAVNGARGPDMIIGGQTYRGFVNDAPAIDKIQAMDPGPKKKDAIESFNRYMAMEKTRETSIKSAVFDTAKTAFERNHSMRDIPEATSQWLLEHDPSALHTLEGWEHEYQGRSSPKGPKPTSTGALIALEADIERNPLKYKGMDPGQFTDIARQAGLTEQDYGRVGAKFTGAQKAHNWALPTASTVNELFQRAFGLSKSRPDTWPGDKQELWRDVHDYVEKQANTWIIKHNGERPGDEELTSFANDRLKKGVVAGGGRFFGDASGVTRVEAEHNSRYAGKAFVPEGGSPPALAAPVKAPAPASKPVTGYRWNKSRTMRKPVYSDGTEGTPEPANGG